MQNKLISSLNKFVKTNKSLDPEGILGVISVLESYDRTLQELQAKNEALEEYKVIADKLIKDQEVQIMILNENLQKEGK